MADSKITDLSEDASPTSDDLIVTVNDPSGTPANKKVTLSNAIKKAHGISDGIVKVASGVMAPAVSGTDYQVPITAGDVTASGATATLVNGSVTLAKQANMATGSVVYRKTAGSGPPEVQTLSILKTDLGLAGTNSGDQTIALTGDITGSGTGSFAATISNDSVTNGKLANMATATLKGRTTSGTGDPEDLTTTQATALLNVMVGDSGSGGTKGLVPAPAAGDASKALFGDGTFKTIPGGGDALTSNPLSQFSSTTSLQLKGVMSDETGSGALVFATSPTLVTPDLGIPSNVVLTNATGTASGLTSGITNALKSATTTVDVSSSTAPVSGQVLRATSSTTATWQTLAGGGDALTTSPLSQFAPTTSAQLSGIISDETGSGSLVFATSPTLTTPNIGTPSSGTLTNCSGLPVSGISGSTSTALGVGSIELGHASDTSIARVSAGVAAIEGKNIALNGTGEVFTTGTIEIGNASDTTLSRSAAGVLAVEGAVIPTVSSPDTLTNKRITQRVVTLTDAPTVNPNSDTTDMVVLTSLSQTTNFENPTGTPTDGQRLTLRVKSISSQSISFGTSYRGSSDLALPTATTGSSKTDYFGFIYNSSDSKWDFAAKTFGF